MCKAVHKNLFHACESFYLTTRQAHRYRGDGLQIASFYNHKRLTTHPLPLLLSIESLLEEIQETDFDTLEQSRSIGCREPVRALAKIPWHIVYKQEIRWRYLWVDSLCIIQDSTEDWLAESAVMGKAYENGIWYIATTASEDGKWGLYRTRDPAYISPHKIDLQSRHHKSSYFTFSPFV